MRLLQAVGAERQCEKILPRQTALDDRSLNALSPRRPSVAQRSAGRIELSVKPRDGSTVLDRLHQAGPLRLRMLHHEAATEATAILLNTGGGIAGGDSHTISITGQPNTVLTISTQSAERIYRAGTTDSPARITTRIRIEAAASVEYLPQETILFDQSALTRRLHIDLTGSSRYLGVETLIFGRAAMGETVNRLDLSDIIELYRDGTLIFRDALKPPNPFTGAARRAMLGNAAGLATILLAAPDAVGQLDTVRLALGDAQAGASVWNGLLLVRILAQTGTALRGLVVRVLDVLRGGRAMPRNWAC